MRICVMSNETEAQTQTESTETATKDDSSSSAQTQTTEKPVVSEDSNIFADTEKESSDFLNMIPEEYRGEPALKNVKNVGNLAKGYLHAQKELGSRIKIPGKDADEETKNEFYSKLSDIDGVVRLPDSKDPEYNKKLSTIYDKLGRPLKPEEYKLDAGNTFVDDELEKEIKQTAFEAGLSQSQLDKLSGLEKKRAETMLNILTTHKANVKKHFQEKWKGDFDANTRIAKEQLAKYAALYPEAAQDVIRGYAGSNPIFIEAMYELGKLHQEETTMGTTDNNAKTELTPQEIRAKISARRVDKADPLNNERHPLHQQAVDEVAELYRQAGEKEQGNSK